MVPYLEFKTTAAPVAFARQAVGYHWGAAAISVGAICSLTSVLLVMSFGQSYVLFVMSRDGLLPKFFGHVHPKYKTPARSSMLVCVVTAITAGFLPINIVAEMTNIGTLCAFIIVSAAVIVLRKKNPNQVRAFKCPLVPLVPLLAIAFCGVLIYMLPPGYTDPLRRMASVRPGHLFRLWLQPQHHLPGTPWTTRCRSRCCTG